MQITRTIEIDAPIDFVWGKISNLTDIQRWSATVTESHFHTELQRGQGAGRTCEVKGFGTLVENVLERKENESFRLSLEGLPAFVKEASGGWRLESLGTNRTRATTFIDLQTRYWPVGALIEKLMLGPKFGTTIEGVQAEFKAFVEANSVAKEVA
jgi:uncharacterized membrane protein